MDEAAEIEGAPEGGSRRRGRHLRVPVTAEEGQQIEELAQQTGLSIAGYLRLVGLGGGGDTHFLQNTCSTHK